MKSFFATLLLLATSLVFAFGQDTPESDFTYQIYQTGKIKILSYIGQDTIIKVPSTIEGKEVARIDNLIKNNPFVKEIYIPASIYELYDLVLESSVVKSIVIGGDNFKTSTYLMKLNNSKETFDHIIILGSKSFKDKEATLTGIAGDVMQLSRIKVTANDELFEFRMLIYTKSKLGTKLENSRFDHILSALQYKGYNLRDITKIDIKNLVKDNGITVEFTNYNPAAFLAPNAVIEIDDKTTIAASTWTIDDEKAFNAPRFDTNTTVVYSRTNTIDWNSVCLPFAIKESNFPEDTKIYTMSGGDGTKIMLTRIDDGASLPAGTPCFIHSKADTWNLNIEAALSHDVAPISVTQEANAWELCGSFTTQTLGTGKYKLNGDGTAFVQTTESSHVYPFRCYLAPKDNGSGAPARLSVDVDEEASITLVPNDAEPATVRLIDLMGRPRQGNAPGLYIRAKH